MFLYLLDLPFARQEVQGGGTVSPPFGRETFYAILDDRERPYYEHRLAA